MAGKSKLVLRNEHKLGLYKVLGYNQTKSNSKRSKVIKVQTKSNKEQKEVNS
mgnify:FL=1